MTNSLNSTEQCSVEKHTHQQLGWKEIIQVHWTECQDIQRVSTLTNLFQSLPCMFKENVMKYLSKSKSVLNRFKEEVLLFIFIETGNF